MDHWFSKNLLIRHFRICVTVAVIGMVLVYLYVWKRLAYDPLVIPLTGYELRIAHGSSLKQFITNLHEIGLLSHPNLMRFYLIYKGNIQQIKAGEYRIEPGTTALQLLDDVFSGSVAQYSFTIIEGWQSKQLMQVLYQHPKIKVTLAGLTMPEIIRQLDLPVQHLEGIFLPDTYFFEADTTDVDFLRRAYFSMNTKLQQAWEQRDQNCILKDSYQALILASIIEKESGVKNEYAEISGVYTRRLAKNMKLQADPTVIYAIQQQRQFSGPLLRQHLNVKSSYNTYYNLGLPPTPIALPSAAAIDAALHPKAGNTLYFVANGDGGHIFSSTLSEHNKAVKKLYAKKFGYQ